MAECGPKLDEPMKIRLTREYLGVQASTGTATKPDVEFPSTDFDAALKGRLIAAILSRIPRKNTGGAICLEEDVRGETYP